MTPRLIPSFGARVGAMVPLGYEAYGRLLHPAKDAQGRAVRWAEVAEYTGRNMHPLVQWHRLVGAKLPHDNHGVWPGDPPNPGSLRDEELGPLVEALTRHTATPEDCWFCWDVFGHAGSTPGPSFVMASTSDSADPLPTTAPAPSELRDWPRVTIHGETYLLARGPLLSAHWIGDWRGAEVTFISEPPLIWWPNDRAWCVGSIMDIDSTVIGGTASLIQDLMDDTRLEVLPVQAHDSLMYDADRLNK
jgi:hypothetical protein